MSQGTALLFLFVVMPIILGVAIAALVQWRSEPVPPARLTSEVLREGSPAKATILEWRASGQSFLDRRPMVTFRVEVRADPPFEMRITQSAPRALLRQLEQGMTVDVRLSPDGTTGAIVFATADDQ